MIYVVCTTSFGLNPTELGSLPTIRIIDCREMRIEVSAALSISFFQGVQIETLIIQSIQA